MTMGIDARERGPMSLQIAQRGLRILLCALVLAGWYSVVPSASAIVIDKDSWDIIYVGLAGISGSASDTVVSSDGVYCQYPADFPIKAPTEVRLWLDGI